MTGLILNYLNLAELSPVQTVTAAGKGGFRAVGIRLTGHAPGENEPGVVGNQQQLNELKQAASASGVGISVLSTYRILSDRKLDDFLPVIEAAESLGIPTMAIHCFDRDERHAIDLIARIAAAARPAGITVALEFIPVSAIKTIQDATRVMQATCAPNVGINVDALHLQRSGGKPADIAAVPPQLIKSVHLCDAPLAPPADLVAEMRAGRLYPGEGGLPLFEILDSAPADVEIEIEVPNAALAGLPPEERAARAHRAGVRFLEGYAQHRGRAPAAGGT